MYVIPMRSFLCFGWTLLFSTTAVVLGETPRRDIQFKKLYEKVETKYKNNTCYPPPNLIFNAFKLADIDKLKVVIVG